MLASYKTRLHTRSPAALISPLFARECLGNPSIHCCQAVHILSPVVSSSPSLKSNRVSMVLASIIPLHSDLSGVVVFVRSGTVCDVSFCYLELWQKIGPQPTKNPCLLVVQTLINGLIAKMCMPLTWYLVWYEYCWTLKKSRCCNLNKSWNTLHEFTFCKNLSQYRLRFGFK